MAKLDLLKPKIKEFADKLYEECKVVEISFHYGVKIFSSRHRQLVKTSLTIDNRS